MGRDPGKAKQETTKTADHMSTESDKSPNGVCSFVFDFQGFCVVCSGWPEPRKSKQKQKNNTADHMSTESDKSPNGVCSFVFLIFKVFAWPAPDGQNLENPKKQKRQNCRPHVHRVRQEHQWGLQFFVFVFDFRGFCMVCSRWPEPRKYKNTKTKTADHMSTESDKSPNGVCSFVFFFEVFAWSAPDGQNLKNQKKTKLQTPLGLLSDSVDMWSAVLFFCFFWIFEVLAIWSRPCKNLENPKKQKNKTADHMSTESDFCPNGV